MSWPVVAVSAPTVLVWQVSGGGTVIVRREHPNGGQVAFIGIVELARDGLCDLMATGIQPPAQIDDALEQLRPHFPPFAESTLARASDLLWGGWAVADLAGESWPPGTWLHLAGFPKPPGTPLDWHQRLIGAGGRTPDLLAALTAAMPDKKLPDGRELVVFTEATLTTTTSPSDVIARLQARPDRLHDLGPTDGGHHFSMFNPYGAGHLTPLSALPGATQALASITVWPDHLTVEASTLNRAGRAVELLTHATGGAVGLADVRWDAPFMRA